MNNEQVEETKLFGVTLDCKLSRSKHIDATVPNMGRGLSIINQEKALLFKDRKKKVGPTGPSFVTPGLLSSRVIRCHKEGLEKITIGQNRAARPALKSTKRANINNMHVNLSSFKVEEKLNSSLLVFVRSIDMLNAQSCLFKLLAHISDTHAYPTRHAIRGLVTFPKSRTH